MKLAGSGSEVVFWNLLESQSDFKICWSQSRVGVWPFRPESNAKESGVRYGVGLFLMERRRSLESDSMFSLSLFWWGGAVCEGWN